MIPLRHLVEPKNELPILNLKPLAAELTLMMAKKITRDYS